jgi:hypothetical protein
VLLVRLLDVRGLTGRGSSRLPDEQQQHDAPQEDTCIYHDRRIPAPRRVSQHTADGWRERLRFRLSGSTCQKAEKLADEISAKLKKLRDLKVQGKI